MVEPVAIAGDGYCVQPNGIETSNAPARSPARIARVHHPRPCNRDPGSPEVGAEWCRVSVLAVVMLSLPCLGGPQFAFGLIKGLA